jgi:hypothetical protein
VPPSTKDTSKRGKKHLFSPSPLVVKIKGKRPFTRSSIPKEDYREKSLPKIPIQKKKGKNIENPVEEKLETLIQKKKGKGAKGPLEKRDENSEKGIEKFVERKQESII